LILSYWGFGFIRFLLPPYCLMDPPYLYIGPLFFCTPGKLIICFVSAGSIKVVVGLFPHATPPIPDGCLRARRLCEEEIELERITNLKNLLAEHHKQHFQGPNTSNLMSDIEVVSPGRHRAFFPSGNLPGPMWHLPRAQAKRAQFRRACQVCL